jgi:2-oxoisovalerate dehydrogenase E1 component beta subunit
MQFADFISCALGPTRDVAAKQFFRGGTPIPIVVRLPSGGGFSGGPVPLPEPGELVRTHPGLKIVCPATPHDAKGLLASAIEDPNPVLFFEHKHLYRRIKGEVPEERYTVPFGYANVHRAGDDATVVTWGAMVHTATRRRRAREGRLRGGGGRLRTLVPWDKERVLEGVQRCSKVLVLHEDTRPPASAPRSQATIAEEAFEHLDAPVVRITAPDTPAPLRPPLEKAYIPQVEDVVTALRELAATRRDSVDGNADRGRDAPDGRVGIRRHSHEVAQAGRRGDRRDEPLLEISTDKVDTEVPSPAEGVVAQILVHEGETVEVGTVIAIRRRRGRLAPVRPSSRLPPLAGGPERSRARARAAAPPLRAPSALRRAALALRQRPAARPRNGRLRLAGRRAHRRRARRSTLVVRDGHRRAGHEEGHLAFIESALAARLRRTAPAAPASSSRPAPERASPSPRRRSRGTSRRPLALPALPQRLPLRQPAPPPSQLQPQSRHRGSCREPVLAPARSSSR